MSGGGNRSIGGNILNRKVRNFWYTHVPGIALLVKQEAVSNVVQVESSCLVTEMPEAGSLANAIKELGRLWCFHNSSCGKSPVIMSVILHMRDNTHNIQFRPQLLDNIHLGKVILHLRSNT